MADLTTAARFLERLDSDGLGVHAERCVRVRHRKADCDLCADACPDDAIRVVPGGGGLSIDPDLCTRCGCCAVVCPTAALVSHDPTSEVLLSAALHAMGESGEAVLACGRAIPRKGYDTEGIARVSCLGRLDETVIVGLVLGGAEKVVLIDGACEDCPHAMGHDIAVRTAQAADDLLECFGAGHVTCFADELPERLRRGRFHRAPTASDEPAREGGVSRRDFLGQMKFEMKSMAWDMAMEADPDGDDGRESLIDRLRVGSDGVMMQQVVHRRERLLEYLDQLGSPAEGTISTPLWGSVEIDPKVCNACHMCATFCPTGALYRADEPADSGSSVTSSGSDLEFLATDCTGCGLCEDVCLKHALKVTHEVRMDDLIACTIERIHMERPVSSGMKIVKRPGEWR